MGFIECSQVIKNLDNRRRFCKVLFKFWCFHLHNTGGMTYVKKVSSNNGYEAEGKVF